MKAITGLLVILLASQSGLAQEAAPKAQPRDKTPDYYPLKVGTKWHYQIDVGGGQKVTVVYQITKTETVNGKPMAILEQLINGEVKATEYVSAETGGVYKYRNNGYDFAPPVCLLKYPIREGSSWQTETKLGTKEFTVIGREGRVEEVQVPAGKYRAVSVKIETTVKGNKISTTYWFAPDVGIVKQSAEYQPGKSQSMELAKFEEGK
jgi:hypothetical protein